MEGFKSGTMGVGAGYALAAAIYCRDYSPQVRLYAICPGLNI